MRAASALTSRHGQLSLDVSEPWRERLRELRCRAQAGELWREALHAFWAAQQVGCQLMDRLSSRYRPLTPRSPREATYHIDAGRQRPPVVGRSPARYGSPYIALALACP